MTKGGGCTRIASAENRAVWLGCLTAHKVGLDSHLNVEMVSELVKASSRHTGMRHRSRNF